MLTDFLKTSEWMPTTLLALSPLIGMVLALVWPGKDDRTVRWGVFAWSLVPLGLVLFLWFSGQFNPALLSTAGDQAMIQQVDRVQWIPFLNAQYFVGLDGMNFPLILLTVALTPFCILASFGIKTRPRVYL
ncbi:MAG: NADH-quinone oxidoreductase subunit M, partial [Herpetosiphonaceae bacterium]|nr:NADH-quinone oxidoreductase subunit M [Herpetosiphonaceae bacterium]